jgi:hypothetical protein
MPSSADAVNRSIHQPSLKGAIQFVAPCGRAVFDTKDSSLGSWLTEMFQ